MTPYGSSKIVDVHNRGLTIAIFILHIGSIVLVVAYYVIKLDE